MNFQQRIFVRFVWELRILIKTPQNRSFPACRPSKDDSLGGYGGFVLPPEQIIPTAQVKEEKGKEICKKFLFFNSFSFVAQEAFEFHRVVAEELFGEFGYLGQERKRGRKSSSLTSSSSPLLFGGGGFGLPTASWAFFGVFLSSLLNLQR